MRLITEAALRAGLAKGLPNPYPVEEGVKLTPAAADFLRSRGIRVERTAAADFRATPPIGRTIPVGVSGRHIHLSEPHVEALFGAGAKLTVQRELSQPGQFAAKETVTLAGPKGVLRNVRVLGPARGATQAEISRTDGFALGVQPDLRLSGDLAGTSGIAVIGPCGMLALREGLIAARNHVHMSVDEAAAFGVKHGDRLLVQTVSSARPVIFPEVIVRVHERFALELHLDTDEANAAGLATGDAVRMVGINGVYTG
ncbi:phosphate propanoyltransferase [Paenibacillus montanisoli]|uniref:Phosphate propanoyltransferase n=1 Tax=Paenibacillus montanisoli TaxID=2081970 RepID=A0A328U0U0_9BACL|nr:phosphate propanoyltransferase [Paenibacillus montanisoli]RAP75061.1 propanediol utilization protein [Paenibacillus montanisoli]